MNGKWAVRNGFMARSAENERKSPTHLGYALGKVLGVKLGDILGSSLLME